MQAFAKLEAVRKENPQSANADSSFTKEPRERTRRLFEQFGLCESFKLTALLTREPETETIK